MRDPDSALRTVLERRQSTYQDAQLALAERERAVAQEREVLAAREARYIATSDQLAERMQASVGRALDVGVLGDLENFLGFCELEIIQQMGAVDAANAEADAARQQLIEAHQGVRSLEVVLAARAKARQLEVRRKEQREADEIAARVHRVGAAV